MQKNLKINTVKITDVEYPSLLKEISSTPEMFYLIGELPSDEIPKIAIVGTRKAGIAGRRFAKELARKLTELGVIVVSGLAMGIDTAAHEGAVLAGGKTIAVLANGLDKIYPAQNENLAEKILELGGALISEYPAGTKSFKNNFLERNRIVSGLSIATIVIEAPERSGSIVTARLAAEQGREVFVVPGSIDNPNYRGSHQLIRDGAVLVSSVEDILEDLGDKIPNSKLQITNKSQIINSKTKNITDVNQLLIIKTIREACGALAIDEIIKITKLEPHIANQSIAFLIIDGIIKETGNGYGL
ncbi:DNA-protecting protein DprA [Candidatus Wolfebacteria bacterium CG_4_10_14_0_8_um_filter_37_11]|uniref:DNA-protecting protein DprA n=1 Tax=Candidatus Wolfebacteria bacterium CG_4_10_14_0_8_um_filter_37_11 TaxID=1975062 RepID=A0A2M7Q8J1_9BACT|nr:MAG: DNA-protecting protein DprA [Candidatus Wolfebacteria bacterium CG_4_10_14_0_8_um_filter_37_11]